MKKMLLLLFTMFTISTYSLEVKLEAKQVIKVDGEEKLVDVVNVKPGDVIEYILTIKNNENKGITGIRPSIPIHESLTLTERKITPKYKVTLDGETFKNYPIRNTEGVPVELDKYRGISWELNKLEPGEKKEYVVSVKVLEYKDMEVKDDEKN